MTLYFLSNIAFPISKLIKMKGMDYFYFIIIIIIIIIIIKHPHPKKNVNVSAYF